jgi:hypothetical protein
MKKIISGILSVTMALCLLMTSASAAGAGTVVYRNTQQLTDNLNYTETISYINNTERQYSYELGLTGSGDAHPIVMACDTIYGRMTADQW